MRGKGEEEEEEDGCSSLTSPSPPGSSPEAGGAAPPMADPEIVGCQEWLEEAESVLRDIAFGVREVTVQGGSPGDPLAHLDLTTLEGASYSIEVGPSGFRLSGGELGSEEESTYYETPYALLNHISPMFQQAFGQQLANKLGELQRLQEQEEDSCSGGDCSSD